MTQRAERAGFFSEKRKLSKYETCLESSFRQKKFHTASGAAETLTETPDYIVIADGDNSSTAITLPTSYFDEDKAVTVINNDAAETPAVGGVACAAVSKTVLRFNGTNWIKLYSVALT